MKIIYFTAKFLQAMYGYGVNYTLYLVFLTFPFKELCFFKKKNSLVIEQE